MDTIISFTPSQLVAFIGSIAGVCAGIATIVGIIVKIIVRLKAHEVFFQTFLTLFAHFILYNAII